MGNPLVDQGQINRLVASVLWKDFPELNVTAPFLGKDGIRLALEGDATTYINTMTGGIPSPEPYQLISATMHLLKPQLLADAYKVQMEAQTFLGDGIVYPDTTTGLSPYPIVNASIFTVRELNLDGTDAVWCVTVRGYYQINQNLFI